jgi:hypothetical protein
MKALKEWEHATHQEFGELRFLELENEWWRVLRGEAWREFPNAKNIAVIVASGVEVLLENNGALHTKPGFDWADTSAEEISFRPSTEQDWQQMMGWWGALGLTV